MLSNFELFLIIGFAIPLVPLGYVIYWALEIRHALFVRLYRNQALGVALVALSLLFSVYSGLPPVVLTAFGIVLVFVGIFLVFYWIDISLRAARRSDPLLRDTLKWSKVRKVLWPLIIGLSVLFIVGIILKLENLANFIAPFPYFIVIASGALYLPVAARRSKDPILRKHFIWFGLFFIGFLIAGSGEGGNFPFILVGDLVTIGGTLFGGYCLYRSARSLVPLNRFPLEEAK